MPQIIVGLDVGTHSIKITQIESSLLRFEFLDFAEHVLPTNTDLSYEELVVNLLRVLFADGGVPTDRIVVSIPGRLVSTRMVRLPFSDRKRIEQTLPFEIEGLIPLPLESVLLDYQILETGPQGTAILVFFTEKEILRNHLSIFRDAGIDPYAVVPPPVALANLGKEISPDEELPIAVIDLGETETSVSILHERSLWFGRSWAMGGRNLTCALANGLDVPEAQARDIKEKEGDLSVLESAAEMIEADRIAPILEKALAPIVAGIRQSLLSVTQSTGVRVEKVFLCGQGSRLRGLSAYLSRLLQIVAAPVVFNGPMSSHIMAQNADIPTLAVSLGLAAHAIRDMRASRINLRTGEFSYVSERAELKRQLVSGGIMAGILLVMLFVLFGQQYSTRSHEYETLNEALIDMGVKTFPELRNVPAGAARISAMNARLSQEQKQGELFSPLSPDSLSVLDIMRTLTEAVPADVQIDVRELAVEGDKVRFDGETSSYNAAEQIKKNLMESGIFSTVDMPEAKDTLDQSKVKFRMVLQLVHALL